MKYLRYGIFYYLLLSCKACFPTPSAVEPITVCGPEICIPPYSGGPIQTFPAVGSATADANCVYHHNIVCDPPSTYITLYDATFTNIENPPNTPNTVFFQCSANDPNTVYVKGDGTSFVVFSIYCPP